MMPDEGAQGLIPQYSAEVRIYSKSNQAQPVFTMSVSGPAKVIEMTVSAGMDAFREDAER